MVKVAYKAYELETKNIKTREHGNRIYKFLHQFFCEPRVPTKNEKGFLQIITTIKWVNYSPLNVENALFINESIK